MGGPESGMNLEEEISLKYKRGFTHHVKPLPILS